jgi:hypothetical protein
MKSGIPPLCLLADNPAAANVYDDDEKSGHLVDLS